MMAKTPNSNKRSCRKRTFDRPPAREQQDCFPDEPHEIDHFMAMVDKTRQHMTDDDRKIVERELKAYGAELTRPRRKPGRTEYVAAIQSVKFGRFARSVFISLQSVNIRSTSSKSVLNLLIFNLAFSSI